jgi:hypothetical protein
MCVAFFSKSFVVNIFCCDQYVANYMKLMHKIVAEMYVFVDVAFIFVQLESKLQ